MINCFPATQLKFNPDLDSSLNKIQMNVFNFILHVKEMKITFI